MDFQQPRPQTFPLRRGETLHQKSGSAKSGISALVHVEVDLDQHVNGGPDPTRKCRHWSRTQRGSLKGQRSAPLEPFVCFREPHALLVPLGRASTHRKVGTHKKKGSIGVAPLHTSFHERVLAIRHHKEPTTELGSRSTPKISALRGLTRTRSQKAAPDQGYEKYLHPHGAR